VQIRIGFSDYRYPLTTLRKYIFFGKSDKTQLKLNGNLGNTHNTAIDEQIEGKRNQ
jgi:hypothetical protein